MLVAVFLIACLGATSNDFSVGARTARLQSWEDTAVMDEGYAFGAPSKPISLVCGDQSAPDDTQYEELSDEGKNRIIKVRIQYSLSRMPCAG